MHRAARRAAEDASRERIARTQGGRGYSNLPKRTACARSTREKKPPEGGLLNQVSIGALEGAVHPLLRHWRFRRRQHELLATIRQHDLVDGDGHVIHGVTSLPGRWPFVRGLPHSEIHIGGGGHGLPAHLHGGIGIEDQSKAI